MVHKWVEGGQNDMVIPTDSMLWHPNSKGHHIYNLNLALIIFSTVFISLRLYVRKAIVKALGWDDFLAVLAWALCVTLSALEMDTTHYGTGAQIEDVPKDTLLQFQKRLTIMELVYLIASGVVRLSILAFLPRLCKAKIYTWSIWGLRLIVIIISLTGFFFILTECQQIPEVFNYASTWRECKDKREERDLMMAHAIICIFVDCMLVALPLWVVTSYFKMGVKSIQILLIFSLGIFGVATGIVRFAIITTTDFTVNTTYKMLSVTAWTDAELHVGLWVGCFPALQPLLRHASFKLGLRNQLDSTKPSGKSVTGISTDESKRRSVLNRWARITGHPPKEGVDSGTPAVSGQQENVEMVDLEKGDEAMSDRLTTEKGVALRRRVLPPEVFVLIMNAFLDEAESTITAVQSCSNPGSDILKDRFLRVQSVCQINHMTRTMVRNRFSPFLFHEFLSGPFTDGLVFPRIDTIKPVFDAIPRESVESMLRDSGRHISR
ncbi:integral membrane protein [Colletotrichum asianum]